MCWWHCIYCIYCFRKINHLVLIPFAFILWCTRSCVGNTQCSLPSARHLCDLHWQFWHFCPLHQYWMYLNLSAACTCTFPLFATFTRTCTIWIRTFTIMAKCKSPFTISVHLHQRSVCTFLISASCLRCNLRCKRQRWERYIQDHLHQFLRHRYDMHQYLWHLWNVHQSCMYLSHFCRLHHLCTIAFFASCTSIFTICANIFKGTVAWDFYGYFLAWMDLSRPEWELPLVFKF